MKITRWIDLDQRSFSIKQNGTSFVVQKYINGTRVEGALCVFSQEEFEQFIHDLPIDKKEVFTGK